MRPSLLIVFILGAVLFISAIITPFIHAGIELILDLFPSLYSLSEFDYDRVMSRIMLVIAVILFVVYRKRLFSPDIWSRWFPKNVHGKRDFFVGVVIAALSLIVLIALTLAIGFRKIDISSFTYIKCIKVFVQAIMSALVVSLIEEVFFRGFVLQTLLNDMKKFFAVLVTSFFYAIVHFTKIEDHPHFEFMDMLSGFKSLLLMVEPLSHPAQFVPECIGLFFVGIILAYCALWTRSLYLSIGLHVGWIFILKIDGLFVTVNQGWNYKFYGTDKMVDGYLSWIILGVVFIVVTLVYMPRKKKEIPLDVSDSTPVH
ncbi:MAG: CPBP family intramembrane metalloprotease [Candidatus Ancaeobacter aquaticus]|nr:CPBP family intramembrane metalloprotease [Candidatus Ancaeobacter aquaticus]